MVDDFTKAGKKALALVVEHDIHDTNTPILLKNCKVREMYYGDEGIWRPPKSGKSAFEMQEAFLDWVDGKFDK